MSSSPPLYKLPDNTTSNTSVAKFSWRITPTAKLPSSCPAQQIISLATASPCAAAANTSGAAAAGSFSHTYADGAASPTIVVSATDEDGTHVLGSKAITVANVAPELAINGASDTDEGAAYSLAIAGSDVAGAADPLSYSIDWGDGSTPETSTTAASEASALATTGSDCKTPKSGPSERASRMTIS